MMRKVLFVGLLLLVILGMFLAGCVNAIHVSHFNKDGEKERLGGIPFYPMAVACKQETVWAESVGRVTLIVVEKETKKEVLNLTKDSSFNASNQPIFKELIDAASRADVEGAIAAFKNLSEHELPINDSLLQTSELILVSNQNKDLRFIDYSDPHYYNVKLPWAGSADTEVTLSPDLTLSKVSVNIQEKTLETIIGSLKELSIKAMEAAAKAPKKEEEEEETRPPTLVIQELTIKPLNYLYTIVSGTGEKAKSLPCPNPGKPQINIDNGSFSITVVSAEPDKSKDKDESQKDEGAIEFSGKIKPPKTP